jgi:hypothetical protein
MFGLVFLLIDLMLHVLKWTIKLTILAIRLLIIAMPYLIAAAVAVCALIGAALVGLTRLTIHLVRHIAKAAEARRARKQAEQLAVIPAPVPVLMPNDGANTQP